MGLSRTDVVAGYPPELAGFEALIRPLRDAEWTTPTRCEGWVVRDVAAHVTGTLAAVAEGRLEELSDPDHIEKQITARADRSAGEVADEMHKHGGVAVALLEALDDAAWSAPFDTPGASGLAATLGHGVETLWYDLYVHAEDVRAALGRPSEPGPGLRVSVHHLADLLADRGWGPATLALDGVEEVPVRGGGERITGDPLQFVLAATGRLDPTTLGLDSTVNVYG